MALANNKENGHLESEHDIKQNNHRLLQYVKLGIGPVTALKYRPQHG